MVLFLLRNFYPFLTEMVLFLLRNFDSFQKWYHFCWAILTLFRNLVSSLSINFCTFLKWYYFWWGFLTLFRYGTILLRIFDPFLTEMVLFLLRNFDPFLEWYHFWRFLTIFDSFLKWLLFVKEFWPFFTIFVDEFWPFSEVVQVSSKFYPFWNEEMVPFLSRGIIFGGFRKSAPTGVILMWYWRDTGLTDCSTYPSHIDIIFFRND